MKSKIILFIVSLAVCGFIFKSSIKDIISKDIEGCTDPNAANYNPKATINNGSCSKEERLSAELSQKIEIFKNSDWDINEYKNLEFEIFTYFKLVDQSGSGQEKISLNKLDMAYMLVLEKATNKLILNCFNSSSTLKNEVRKFYKKYKEQNVSIKITQDVFDCHSKIYTYKSKVKKMLENEFVKQDVDALKEKINKFSNSGIFLKISNCNKFKNIISDCIADLDKFEAIDSQFFMFEEKYKPSLLNLNEIVPNRYFEQFKDYAWYYNKVVETDKRLREQKRLSDSLELLQKAEIEN